MGTPDFAVPSLKKMIEAPALQVVGVVTQPDRPKGRGNKLTAPPIKALALDSGIQVFQPQTVNSEEAYSKLKEWGPEAIVVVAFGQILKSAVLELPPLGCINVHGSLLPKYRGAAPIHWAIINGEKTTGITTMYMDPGMDTGDIILQEELSIGPLETIGELHDRMAALGGKVLLATLDLLGQGKAPRRPQEDREATYAPLLKKEHEVLDWGGSALEVVNHIRGMNPWPGAHTTLHGKVLKIWRAHQIEHGTDNGGKGKVVAVENQGIIVQTGLGQVIVTELQMQARSRMAAGEFLRGYPVKPGEVLGEIAGGEN